MQFVLAQSQMAYLDMALVGVYIVTMFAIALRVRYGQTSQTDYFLGGRNIHWGLIAISAFATLFSTITFVAVPAEAYSNGLQLAVTSVVAIPLLPLAVHTVLRFFFRQPMMTAYEYLELRYNGFVRSIGAYFFLIARLLYMCVILYAISLVFTAVFELPIYVTIFAAGALTTVYTMIGGMRAVVLTDVAQSVMLLVGVVAILWTVSQGIGHDWATQWQTLAAEDARYSFSSLLDKQMLNIGMHDRINALTLLFGLLHMPFMAMSSDQLVVQRMLSTKGYTEARRAVYLNMVLGLIAAALVWSIGLGMVLFYRQNPDVAPAEANQVIGHFIRTQLVSPMPGILCAAMLAMIMSTIDSTINSLSAVLENDILRRLRHGREGSLGESRLVSVMWGSLAIVLTLGVAYMGESGKLPVIELASVLAAGWGVLTVAFVLGVLTSWTRPRAMGIAMVLGLVTNVAVQCWYLFTPADVRISFAYTPMIPTAVTLVSAIALSLLDRSKYEAPDGTCFFHQLPGDYVGTRIEAAEQV